MVLKVVRGKILETLELWCSPKACGVVFGTADGGCSDAMVEECDYLADNIHAPILSVVIDKFKKKVDGPSARFRNGNVV
jgi:hypothetical protein